MDCPLVRTSEAPASRRQQLPEWLRPCWRDERRNGALRLFCVWLRQLGGLVVRAADIFQRLKGEEGIRFHAHAHHESPAKKGHLNTVLGQGRTEACREALGDDCLLNKMSSFSGLAHSEFSPQVCFYPQRGKEAQPMGP